MEQNTAAAKSAATKALRTCRCGCGAALGGKAAYRPGHDARHVSNLKQDLMNTAATDHSDAAIEKAQAEVFAIFGQLKTEALRAKLGRAVDNDKEGLYNSFGDQGIYVPYSENPSLGMRHAQADLQAKFEAANPVEAAKARKAKDAAPAVADEPWITHEPIDTGWEDPIGPAPIAKIKGEDVEPMWEETTEDPAPLEVRIGRWTYPARQTEDGLLRNTKRDGSGEWVKYQG